MNFLDRFKKHRICNDNWEFYQSFDEKEQIVFSTIDLTYKEIENQKGFAGELFIRIRIPEKKLHEGIPIPEEQQFQNDKEEELCQKLIKTKTNCKEVGRLTFDGQKQYIFEYNDLDSFMKTFEEWKKSFNQEYSVELNLTQAFEYYSELLPDKYLWQQIGNRHVIEQLLATGSDESKEHFIEHGIYGNTENLKKLFDEIKGHNIEMIGIEGGFMELGIKSSIELEDITDQTDYLIETSEKYNCKYDGWSTEVVK